MNRWTRWWRKLTGGARRSSRGWTSVKPDSARERGGLPAAGDGESSGAIDRRMAELVDSVQSHLRRQREFQDRVAENLDRIPPALECLEHIRGQLDERRRSEEAMAARLRRSERTLNLLAVLIVVLAVMAAAGWLAMTRTPPPEAAARPSAAAEPSATRTVELFESFEGVTSPLTAEEVEYALQLDREPRGEDR